MMNIFLQAAAVADTLAGGNPVLTPLASGEPQMNFHVLVESSNEFSVSMRQLLTLH